MKKYVLILMLSLASAPVFANYNIGEDQQQRDLTWELGQIQSSIDRETKAIKEQNGDKVCNYNGTFCL
jgi:hypothetical protein